MKKFFTFIFVLILVGFVSAADCDNIGERTSTQYCSVDGQWEDFKEVTDPCENDFECSSNYCIEGTCSSTSVKEEYEKQKTLLGDIWAWLSGKECIYDEDCIGNDNGYICLADNTCGCNSDSNCPSGEECKYSICLKPGEEPPKDKGTSSSTRGGGTRTSGIGDDYDTTKTFTKILPNRNYCFDINELPIPVTKICFISNTETSNIKFDIERQEVRSSIIPKPEDLVYQYFTINTENLPNQYIEKADITFRIPKTWLDDNNLKTYKLILQRYLSSWNILKPQIIAEDNVYYYYNTNTPGFSWFSITSMPKTPTTIYIPPTTEPMCGDGIIDIEENCINCPEDVVCEDDEYCYQGRCVLEKKISIWRYLIPALLILLIIVLILILRRKKTLVFIKEKRPTSRKISMSDNRFKNIRLREGLKKAAIARTARVSTSTITNIEKNIDVKELSKRASLQALNILIERKTGVKNKYSYEQVFGQPPITTIKTIFPSKLALTNLKNYIKKALAAKMTKARIKSLLISKGWKENQVDYIFKQFKK